jgi:3-hydroxymyristoyl/3-hydroxydecanoyl-(acyl carrier protein) dehydratase
MCNGDLQPPRAAERPREPEALSTTLTAEGLVRLLIVQPELAWFEGHFPDEPILAGVVQIRWAIAAARELLGVTAGPTAIVQLKFKAPIRPNARLELEIRRVADGASFCYRSATGEHSSARLVFARD